MSFGPGKYDNLAEVVRTVSGARDGVLLLVLEGHLGSGFSVLAAPAAARLIPQMLRDVADQMERDLSGVAQN